MARTLAEQTFDYRGIGRNPPAFDAIENTFVAIPDATTYTVLAADSGKVFLVPDFTSSCAITLPAAAANLVFTFQYAGNATDAQNFTLTSAAFARGGVVMLDLDAGAGTDEVSAVYANGSSHVTLTVTGPAAGTSVTVLCDGTKWVYSGTVVSNTACAFS